MEGIYSQFTQEKITECQEAFRTFDKDGDGAIDAKELRSILQSIGKKPTESEVKDMIKRVDSDGNGKIDFSEFLSLISDQAKHEPCSEDFRQLFSEFDLDGDGFISEAELKQVMKNLGENFSDAQVKQMIREADLDGDGRVNYEEFVQMQMSNK